MYKLEDLVKAIESEAKREEFPIDVEVYTNVGKNHLEPILFAGNLESEICFFARDLGKDEVKASQPLYGSAGKLVRKGVYKRFFGEIVPNDESLQKITQKVLLTNTVPYKPPGNKAYSTQVKERFRPFIAQFLIYHWKGSRIITLGAEALEWFSVYDKEKVKTFSKKEERFKESFELCMEIIDELGQKHSKNVIIMPLPHPSPLNQKYYSLFPSMLQERLA